MNPTDSVDIRKYNVPLDVIEHYILKFVKYPIIDAVVSGFRLTPKEHAGIKFRIYNKRLKVKRWMCSIEYEVDGLLHREGDLPAAIDFGDFFDWFYNGIRHRDHGPAMLWVHPICYYCPRTKMIHVNNIGVEWEKLKIPTSMPLVPNTELLYKEGNHPRPYGWAVVAFYDGVRLIDYYGDPVIDNGPIAILKIVSGCIRHNGVTINNNYCDEMVDLDDPLNKKWDHTHLTPVKLINWDKPIPIPV